MIKDAFQRRLTFKLYTIKQKRPEVFSSGRLILFYSISINYCLSDIPNSFWTASYSVDLSIFNKLKL